MSVPDPRTTLARADLAADWLEGLVPAARYASTQPLVCAAPAVAIRAQPLAAAEQQDQLLFGERFEALEVEEGWAWGQARRSGYVGHVRADALSPAGPAPTHWVSVPRTYAFAEPSIKAQAQGPYSLNSLVAVEAREGRFAKASGGGWFVAEHLSPVGVVREDPAAVAERLTGAAYLWGGRESCGLDCSGLVQQALFACGLACPRDTDQQAGLGRAIGEADLRRADLVFWRGHVAMMLDETRVIHANAHHMAVAAEPLAEARARIKATGGGEPTAFRRVGFAPGP